MDDLEHEPEMNRIHHKELLHSEWVSYHLFHSQPGDDVLRGLVLPAVRELGGRRRFSRFFFIRYGEDGLHIRLRFLCSDGDRQDIGDTLRSQGAVDDRLIESTFEPETERYGGAELLGHSLDFFCVSSAFVLHHLEHNAGAAKSRFLALSLRALVRQALGFASDEEGFMRLLAYVVNGDWQTRSILTDRADREVAARREDYSRLLSEEIQLFLDSESRFHLSDTLLTEGSLLLSQQVHGASDTVRRRILRSQLHMTWNRLGVSNLEEIYLGRILWQAVRHLIASQQPFRSALAEALAQRRLQLRGGFEELAAASLVQLVGRRDGNPAVPIYERALG